MDEHNSTEPGLPAEGNKDGPLSKLGLAEWLSIVQFAAVLIGGVWVAFMFVAFDAHDKIIAAKLAELTVEKTGVETETGKIGLSDLRSRPLQIDQDMSVWPRQTEKKDGPGELRVQYRYSIRNVTHQDFKIVFVAVSALILPKDKLNVEGEMFRIPPPDAGKGSPWHRVLAEATVIDKDFPAAPFTYSTDNFTVKPSGEGPLTGLLEPSQTRWDTFDVIVPEKNAEYVGFTVDVFVKFKDGPMRQYATSQFEPLLPGTYPGSPKSAFSSEAKSDEKK